MPGLLDTIMGRTPVPTAQQQAGGIPQNADPGKGGLLGGKGPLTGRNLNVGALSGNPGRGAPDASPSPVTPFTAPGGGQGGAQLMPDSQPIAPVAQPMGGNPMMMQALMQRMQQQRGGGY